MLDTPVKFCLWCLTEHMQTSDWRTLINSLNPKIRLNQSGHEHLLPTTAMSRAQVHNASGSGSAFDRTSALSSTARLSDRDTDTSHNFTCVSQRARAPTRATRAEPAPEPSRGYKSGNSPKKSIRNALKSLFRRERAQSAFTFPLAPSK